MKIGVSSAEFTLNSQILPLLFPSGEGRKFSYEDIDKFNTWQEYKVEIKQFYPISNACNAAYITKDVHGNEWVFMAGTGFCNIYSIR